MQNNEHSNPNRVKKFFRDKGYYIVLALCICAVGVSGYIFISGAIAEKNALSEPALSVATSAVVPERKSAEPSAAKSGSAGAVQKSRPAGAAAKAVESDEKVFAAAAAIRVWPISGQTLAGYAMEQLSYNPTTQDWRTHDGVDLAATLGESVRAACAGTVTSVYDDEYLGTTVTIRHDGGYETRYSNLAAMPTVSAGDTVAAGDVIGSVGQTALLEAGAQPHLHFSVCCGGQSIEPAEFIG